VTRADGSPRWNSSTIRAWPSARSGRLPKRLPSASLTGITAIHRYGKIAPGGNIVLVVVTAPHRQAAFDGASFLMDFLKTDAPFWKKEHLKDGGSGEWVSAKDADDKAKLRWQKS
jgi:molybdopterin synthase catalytic subunit